MQDLTPNPSPKAEGDLTLLVPGSSILLTGSKHFFSNTSAALFV